jgi:membrane protein DedA with SNARE-associated domain
VLGLTGAIRLFIAHYGLFALFLILTVEEAGVWLPLPGDVIILYFGYRLARSANPMPAAALVLLVITVAVVCGSSLLYLVTRRWGRVIRRLGRVLHIDERREQQIQSWIRGHGRWVVIVGRIVPGLRIPTTVVCGSAEMPFTQFLPAVSIAAFVWGLAYLSLGASGGYLFTEARALLRVESYLWRLAAGLFFATAIVCVILTLRRRRSKKRHRSTVAAPESGKRLTS